jgi:hypothetical protein
MNSVLEIDETNSFDVSIEINLSEIATVSGSCRSVLSQMNVPEYQPIAEQRIPQMTVNDDWRSLDLAARLWISFAAKTSKRRLPRCYQDCARLLRWSLLHRTFFPLFAAQSHVVGMKVGSKLNCCLDGRQVQFAYVVNVIPEESHLHALPPQNKSLDSVEVYRLVFVGREFYFPASQQNP